jgi:hypothetical protein
VAFGICSAIFLADACSIPPLHNARIWQSLRLKIRGGVLVRVELRGHVARKVKLDYILDALSSKS